MKFSFAPVLPAVVIGCLVASRGWAGDADIKLTTTNGSTKFTIQNSNGVEVSSITSLGDAAFNSLSLRTPLPVAQGGTGSTSTDPTLAALAAYNTNGLLTQTAADTFTGRTLTAGSNKLIVTNGNGVAGDPTVDLNEVYSIVASNQTAGTSLTDVTGMSFAVNNGETWSFEMNLQVGSSSTAGVKYALTFPAGTMLATIIGSTSATACRSDVLSVSGTASSGAYQTQASAAGTVRLTGVFTATGNGTVQLQQQKVTSGTATVYANSYMVARQH